MTTTAGIDTIWVPFGNAEWNFNRLEWQWTYNPIVTYTPMPTPAWVCPRCQRVYGPNVFECFHCNKMIEEGEKNEKNTRIPDSLVGEFDELAYPNVGGTGK